MTACRHTDPDVYTTMHGPGSWFEPVLWHKCPESIHTPRAGEPFPIDADNIVRAVLPLERKRLIFWQCGPPQ